MNEQGMFRAIALLAAIPQTELNELTVVLITLFPDKLVTSELKCTELMLNYFEYGTRILCKFTNSSGPASHHSGYGLIGITPTLPMLQLHINAILI